MLVSTYLSIYLFAILQFNSNTVLGQRTFTNPAVTDPAPCACNLKAYSCDPNCCCDPNCSSNDLSASPVCQGVRTVSSYSSSQEENLQTWNCSNSTSDALYDYFPFVCVQLKLNEVIGEFYPVDNISFITSGDNVGNLPSEFSASYPELFQSPTLTTSTTTNYSIGAPVQTLLNGQAVPLTLPGNLVGSVCQGSANVLFGVNRDVVCSSYSLTTLCNAISSTPPIILGGGSTASINVNFYTQTYFSPALPARNLTTQYYFQDGYSLSSDNINYTIDSINDYCPGNHPLNRIYRYFSSCNATSGCSNGSQTYSQCAERDTLLYSTIPTSFFINESSSTDDSANFADFSNPINATAASCSTTATSRIFYRFYYSSSDNTISNVSTYFLILQSGTVTNPRITIQWIDTASSSATNTTIPRGYLSGEVLQFRRSDAISDVSVLIPTGNGYCIDANRKTLRYKQSVSSQCFIQLPQSAIQQCHKLKLDMYLYLNVFYAPASAVLAYPSNNATQIPIRDPTQDSLDLDRIDETRPNNRLNATEIAITRLYLYTPTIYDIAQSLPICFDIPSGIYIEFGYVRVYISPTVSFERIISVRYNYTYSNWQFDCKGISCTGTTQKYLVTFQSAFVDYTDSAFSLPTVTTADMTSADNYIQHLLWLITPEYKGEPGYRNYTIAMILIFIAISAIVVHVLLFGIMCPF